MKNKNTGKIMVNRITISFVIIYLLVWDSVPATVHDLRMDGTNMKFSCSN